MAGSRTRDDSERPVGRGHRSRNRIMNADPDSCSPGALAQDDPEPDDSGVAIRVTLDSGDWIAFLPEAEALVSRAARAALARAGFTADHGAELGLALADDDTLQRLNRTYRGIDRPTNVLAFPAEDGPTTSGARLLGDVVLAAGTLQREADEQGKTPTDHLAHLVVHGVLHLLGYDHQRETEAQAMEALEREILAGLGIADPYREPVAPNAAAAGG